MCSRYSLTSPPEAVRATFAHHNEEEFPPRYNIAPTQPVAIVRIDQRQRRELALVRWGLIPSWVKDPAQVSTMINARAETAEEKPSFRGSMRHRRCLVPADGYYEWVGRPGAKRPHLLRARAIADGKSSPGPIAGPMAFAGLWEHWLGADGSEIETMAVLTMPANAVAGRLHDRMPAILFADQFAAWLDVSSGHSKEAAALLRPAPDDLLEILEVSPKLNNSRNEGPDVQEIVCKLLI